VSSLDSTFRQVGTPDGTELSFTVPFSGKRLLLGTWQQIVFLDFDNRERRRELVVQIIGE
jgi:thiamine phosphate synthase YjbQ (UPF0047 family)